VPVRLAWRPPRREGPAPFSAEWLNAPPTLPERRVPALPAWFPSERLLSAGLVLMIVAAAALAADGDDRPARVAAPADGPAAVDPGPGQNDAGAVAMAATTAAVATVVATAAPTSAATAAVAPTTPPQPTPTYVPAPGFVAAPTTGAGGASGGALLPKYRLLTYYGHPHDENMGIVGEYPKEELLAKLREQAAAYEAADPSRPVMIGFEVIATVAQRDPGVDGTYLLPTDKETLEEYADFAAANNILLFLDVQIGRDSVANEIEKVRFLLERPQVHLAIDPEFAIAAKHGLPPKVLIVHQFVHEMIRYKDQLYPIDGVQLVINADGHGSPALKTDIFNILVRDEPVQFGGIKLFYREDMDSPLMPPADIVALDPPPDVVMYQ